MTQKSSIKPLIFVILFVVVAFILYQQHCADNKKDESATPPQIEIGAELYLKGNSATAPVAIDNDSFYEFEKALAAKDNIGLNRLMESKILILSNGTKVLVIDRDGYGALKVRILEGRYVGQTGWTDPSWVTKESVAAANASNASQNPNPENTPFNQSSPINQPSPISQTTLHRDGVKKLPVADSQDDFYELQDAIDKNDNAKALAMIQRGRILMVENDIPIVVLEPFGYLTKVKIKKSGHQGWVQSSWIR